MHKKVSIIMPTYNDELTIHKSLDSIMNQTYKNIELIIVDDGSTDSSKKIIEKYKAEKDKNNKITYIHQTNQDQLNAILNGLNYIHGDYIYIAHSDDILNGNDIIYKCVEYMDAHNNLDAIISDLIIIDENNNYKGLQKTKKYVNKKYIIPLLQLWLGRNLYVDVAFYRTASFINYVKKSYLTWNTPFWLNLDTNTLLNVQKVDFKFMQYRISSSNYINSEIGLLNVINGELRTILSIMYSYNIPCYKFQYILFRIFNKFNLNYIPIYKKTTQKNIDKIIEFVIRKRFGNNYKNNIFLNSIVCFFKSNKNRTITIDSALLKNTFIYYGKDVRKFNTNLMKNNLDEIYNYLFNEMQYGFFTIIVKDNEEKEKIETITKFLCIYPYIKISVEGD